MALSEIVELEGEYLRSIPHGDESSVESVRIGIHPGVKLNAKLRWRKLLNLLNAPVESCDLDASARRLGEGETDRAILDDGIREGFKFFNAWQRRVRRHAKLERETEFRGVVLDLREFLGVDPVERERELAAFNLRFGVGDAPLVGVPVAEFKPAEAAAARLEILRQMFLRPAAAPIFEPHLVGRGRRAGEPDDDPMDLTRVFPHDAVAFGQRQTERRGVKRRSGKRRGFREGETQQSEAKGFGEPAWKGSGFHIGNSTSLADATGLMMIVLGVESNPRWRLPFNLEALN